MQSVKHEWTPAEKTQLLKIKNNSSRKAKLEAIAATLGIPYADVYAKWNYIQHQAGTFVDSRNGNKPTAKSASKAPLFVAPTVTKSSQDITPMTFGVIENFNAYNRIDMKEQLSLEKGLDIQIKQGIITPQNKRAILIPKKLAQRAKKYLIETYNTHSYCVSTGKNVKEGYAAISRTK